MKRILSLLFSSPYKDILWFKGGTLAYLCYDLDRFSTDIDIDILDLNLEEEIIVFLNNELPSYEMFEDHYYEKTYIAGNLNIMHKLEI